MDLTRRMPPSLSQQALESLLALLPAHSSELLSQSDQPLQVEFFSFSFSLFMQVFVIFLLPGRSEMWLNSPDVCQE